MVCFKVAELVPICLGSSHQLNRSGCSANAEVETARDLVPLTCVLSYDHVVCDYVMQITGSTKNGVNHTWFVENIFLLIAH